MTITRIQSSDAVRESLARRIVPRLRANEPVLFIASGGSTAPVAAGVCADIAREFRDRAQALKLLMSVTLADERYGAEGHPDSNWRRLLENGLDPGPFASFPIIRSTAASADGADSDARAFGGMLADAAARRDQGALYVVGLFGVGEDGHTAGILPGSPAAAIPADGHDYAIAYRSAIFYRITMTPAFFGHVDFAAALAAGPEKRAVIESLRSDGSAAEQPARLIALAREYALYVDGDADGDADRNANRNAEGS